MEIISRIFGLTWLSGINTPSPARYICYEMCEEVRSNYQNIRPGSPHHPETPPQRKIPIYIIQQTLLSRVNWVVTIFLSFFVKNGLWWSLTKQLQLILSVTSRNAGRRGRIIFADVDTELTCDTRQPGALHNMEIFYKIIQKYFQQFPSYLQVPGPVSPAE